MTSSHRVHLQPAARGLRRVSRGASFARYRNGENVAIDCRSADGDYEQLDKLAAELVKLNPAVLVAAATPASLAAKRATPNIRIISVYTADPVELGLVEAWRGPAAMSREFLRLPRTMPPSRCSC